MGRPAVAAIIFPIAINLDLGRGWELAYQLNSKTVLRAGAALLIGTTADNGIQTRSVTSVNQVNSTAFAQAPMTLATGVPLTYAQVAWPNFDPSHFPVVPIAGTPGAAPGAWIDPNAGYPSKSYQWSVGVQREIVRNLVVEAAYVGNRGVWLPSHRGGQLQREHPAGPVSRRAGHHHRVGPGHPGRSDRQCGCRPVPEQAAVRGFPAYCDGSAVAAAVPAIHIPRRRRCGPRWEITGTTPCRSG